MGPEIAERRFCRSPPVPKTEPWDEDKVVGEPHQTCCD
jgi:hypothetical protein